MGRLETCESAMIGNLEGENVVVDPTVNAAATTQFVKLVISSLLMKTIKFAKNHD